MSTNTPLRFHTQGDKFSYHAKAVEAFMGDTEVEIVGRDTFGEVIRASRLENGGLGAIAICTVAGTVDDSARSILTERAIALPDIVGRQDIEVQLSLISSVEQDFEEVCARRGVSCLAQKQALLQCEAFIAQHMPWLRRGQGHFRRESVKAVREALEANNPNVLALGPHHVAEALGAYVLGPEQVNPLGSTTSFYILQGDPEQDVLPHHPDRTEDRTILSIAHPEGPGEFAKCMEVAEDMGIRITRFIPFDVRDFTRHDRDTRRGGGILELAHRRYDHRVAEFGARVIGLHGIDGHQGPFNAKILGRYKWYPEEPLEPMSLVSPDDEPEPEEINFDRLVFEMGLDIAKVKKIYSKAPVAQKKQLKALARALNEATGLKRRRTKKKQSASQPIPDQDE